VGVGLAVGGGGAGEDEAVDIGLGAGSEEVQGSGGVVEVVAQGLFDAVADVAEGGEVHDGADVVALQDVGDAGGVVDGSVDGGERCPAPGTTPGTSGELLEAVEGAGIAADQVVDDDDVVAAGEEAFDGVGADVARSSGDQHGHGDVSVVRRLRTRGPAVGTRSAIGRSGWNFGTKGGRH